MDEHHGQECISLHGVSCLSAAVSPGDLLPFPGRRNNLYSPVCTCGAPGKTPRGLPWGRAAPCAAQMAHELFVHLVWIFTASAKGTLCKTDDTEIFHGLPRSFDYLNVLNSNCLSCELKVVLVWEHEGKKKTFWQKFVSRILTKRVIRAQFEKLKLGLRGGFSSFFNQGELCSRTCKYKTKLSKSQEWESAMQNCCQHKTQVTHINL